MADRMGGNGAQPLWVSPDFAADNINGPPVEQGQVFITGCSAVWPAGRPLMEPSNANSALVSWEGSCLCRWLVNRLRRGERMSGGAASPA